MSELKVLKQLGVPELEYTTYYSNGCEEIKQRCIIKNNKPLLMIE